MSAVLLSVQVGLPVILGEVGASDPANRPWATGFLKSVVAGPVWVGRDNLTGDGQADRINHGGPDKVVCVYPADHYEYWRAKLNRPTFDFGAFGENLTLGRLTETTVCIGDVWTIGEARFQVSQPRQPCWKLARRHAIADLALQVQQTGHTGWYFRVLAEGNVAAGLPATLTDRPFPEWTIDRANQIMHHQKDDTQQAKALAALPLLSASWRSMLEFRVNRARGEAESPRAD